MMVVVIIVEEEEDIVVTIGIKTQMITTIRGKRTVIGEKNLSRGEIATHPQKTEMTVIKGIPKRKGIREEIIAQWDLRSGERMAT